MRRYRFYVKNNFSIFGTIFTFYVNLPWKWVKNWQKLTKSLHLQIVLCIILMSFMLFLAKNFDMSIVKIRKFCATNKNKVSIIICQPTVLSKSESVKFSLIESVIFLFTESSVEIIFFTFKSVNFHYLISENNIFYC